MADGDPHNEALNAATPPRPDPAMHSIHSREQSFVCFVNCTQRNVDVFWVDFQGRHIKYKTLARRERYKINTYVTHPWVFRDSETSSALVVNSEEAFYPKPVLQPGQQVYGPASPRHIIANICIPLYSLKDRAAQVVWSCVHDPQAVFSLEIPKVLMLTIAKWANCGSLYKGNHN